MKKSDLGLALSQKENLTEKQATEIVNLIFDGFTKALKKGERIELRGFGSFSLKEYGPYTGRNPKSGNKVHVEGKRLSFFKVSKEMRERVRGKWLRNRSS
jgi:integration host factor subunit beta